MVGFALGNNARFVNGEYHETRANAVRTTLNESEWSEIDVTRYDLDELEFTGKQNDETYRYGHPVNDDEINVNGEDYRQLPTLD